LKSNLKVITSVTFFVLKPPKTVVKYEELVAFSASLVVVEAAVVVASAVTVASAVVVEK